MCLIFADSIIVCDVAAASSAVFIPAREAEALNLNTTLPGGFVIQNG